MDAPLSQRLALYASALRQHAAPLADAYEELVKRLQSAQSGSNAPKAGEEMPPFARPVVKQVRQAVYLIGCVGQSERRHLLAGLGGIGTGLR